MVYEGAAVFEWTMRSHLFDEISLIDVGTATVSGVGGGSDAVTFFGDGASFGLLASSNGNLHFPRVAKTFIPGDYGEAQGRCTPTGILCGGTGRAIAQVTELYVSVRGETTDSCQVIETVARILEPARELRDNNIEEP